MDPHQCYFCGTYVKDGYETTGKRHWLSDCRPDLVEHEIGDLCTWAYRRNSIVKENGEIIEPLPENMTCYAYEESSVLGVKRHFTNEHTHFYSDGPM